MARRASGRLAARNGALHHGHGGSLLPQDRSDGCGDEFLAADRQELFLLVYSELRRLAVAAMADQGRQVTLQPTALVHEAYLRIMAGEDRRFASRAHFFRTAARAMRTTLVDVARARSAQKRGGGNALVTLSEGDAALDDGAFEALAVHDALARLEQVDERSARVVELRFFCGLEMEEIAAALETTVRTVYRDWEAARAWLFRELSA